MRAIRLALRIFGLFILRNSYKVTLAGLYFVALVHVNLWNAGYSMWTFSAVLTRFSAILYRLRALLLTRSICMDIIGSVHRICVVHHLYLANILDEGHRAERRITVPTTWPHSLPGTRLLKI